MVYYKVGLLSARFPVAKDKGGGYISHFVIHVNQFHYSRRIEYGGHGDRTCMRSFATAMTKKCIRGRENHVLSCQLSHIISCRYLSTGGRNV